MLLLAFGLAASASADSLSVGTWWWKGRDIANDAEAANRLAFLSKQGVSEIFFCADWKVPREDIARFVRSAKVRGMSVECLSGDASWIRPGNLGFDEFFAHYRKYQKSAPADARFSAIHLDVEPHVDRSLSDARKWQLYADFVMRAAALAHVAGERIEWDIPFWLDSIRVLGDTSDEKPLLEILMDRSDGVVLMSYRDTAAAVLECGKTELEMGKTHSCRVMLGVETGPTQEGPHVSFYGKGAARLAAELDGLKEAVSRVHLKRGGGVAVHHVGTWMSLNEQEPIH